MKTRRQHPDPKAIVRTGYDRVSEVYSGDSPDDNKAVLAKYCEWIVDLALLLEPGSPVLDLGCGNGIPADRLLVDAGFHLTGVDISPVQIARAQKLIPEGVFFQMDMSLVDFAPASFSAVVALYSIIHIPLAEQPDLFKKIRAWLRPGGYLLAIVGAEAWTGEEKNWLGVEGAGMYWSHADVTTYVHWLEELGFEVIRNSFIPEGEGGHRLILARR
jgi:cyclopropane fatty-acyl-phospholipid synthase-like methyltransferase